ncbi:ficolin-2-like [Mercenaria mercenaria]|uniref:ficolin-2-like n=1 Tax=Mercenaria mercenaria TaxID=6596 RepID=UPI00234E6420|nr:ficolin-2-like [Mercenaria mercenaria]
MDQSKAKMFSHFVTIVAVLNCILVTQYVKAKDSRKLDVLRQRIQRIETRLTEDIALIREEFHHELSEISNDVNDNEDGDISEYKNDLKGLDIETEFKKLENDISDKLKALQLGLSEEKRVRRDIENEVQVIKAEELGLVQAIEKMTENSTGNFENVIKKLNTKKELFEIISLLKDLKAKLFRLRDSVEKNETSEPAADCAELLMRGHLTSGIYQVFPKTMWRPLKVFCDMGTDGGGWTVFQRRKDGSENFDRKWLDYSFGFGNLSGEFWLGNEFVHRFTHQVPHELRIELEDFDNDRRVAKYGLFSIGSAVEGYKLSVNYFEGNVSDSLTGEHNGKAFSTTDQGPSTGCSNSYKGGWWYGSCHNVNINGLYLRGQHESYANGINWNGWLGYHYSLKMTEMKFKPK